MDILVWQEYREKPGPSVSDYPMNRDGRLHKNSANGNTGKISGKNYLKVSGAFGGAGSHQGKGGRMSNVIRM
jgi:hypothetical protein